MKILLDATHVVAGESLCGRVVDGSGRPLATDVWLERRESNGTLSLPASGTEVGHTVSDGVTGRFVIRVPLDVVPTQIGTFAAIDWMVASRGKASMSFGEELARVVVDNPSPPGPAPALLATAGADPQKLRALVHEHFLSIFMGLLLFAMCAAFALYAWFGDVEHPPPPAVPVVLLVISLVPLAAAYLAIRTIWPRRPKSLELIIEPAIAHPGDTITVRHVGGRLKPARFLSIESFMGTIESYVGSSAGRRRRLEAGVRRTTGQYETHESRPQDLRFDGSGTASFTIPVDAAPSFTGKITQVRWVVRVGGAKTLRWGPIYLREWNVVVVDKRIDIAALTTVHPAAV